MRRIILMAVLLALVTAACKLEFNLAADIGADATGTVTIEVGFDEEAAGFFLQDTDPFEDLPPGAQTSTEERGDMTFYRITQSFTGEEELAALMTGDEAPFESFGVTFTEDLVTISGTTGTGGGFFDDSDLEGFGSDELADSLAANIRITMPGKVLEHNADAVDGGTLTWGIDILGGALTISAQSDPTQEADTGGGGFPAWLIAVLALVVVAAVGYFLYNRTRSGPTFEPEPPAPSPEQ